MAGGRLALKEPLALITDELTPRRLNMAALMRFSQVLHGKQNREPVSSACAPDRKWVTAQARAVVYDWEHERARHAAAAVMTEPALSEAELSLIRSEVAVNAQRQSWSGALDSGVYWLLLVVAAAAALGVFYIVTRASLRESPTLENGRVALVNSF